MTAAENSDSTHLLAEKIRTCQNKLSRQPGDRALRLKLADLLVEAREFDQAIEAYRKVRASKPGNKRAGEGLRRIGQLLHDDAAKMREEGRLDEAAAALKRCLELEPKNADIWLLQGVTLFQQQRDHEAYEHWQRAVALNPGLAAAHSNIGMYLLRHKNRDEAMDAFRQALVANPKYDSVCSFLAGMLTDSGRYEEAQEVCDKLLALEPRAPETLAAMAELQERRGSVQAAYEFLKPQIDAGVRHPRVLNAFGRICHRMKPTSAEAIPYLQALLKHPSLRRIDRIKTLTTLAQLCDATERYDEALRALKEARALDTVDLRVVQQRVRFVEGARTQYTRERLDGLPHARNHSPLPLFVVGMPRSGTTLTEQILSAHPHVHGAGELTHVGKTVVSGFGTEKQAPEYFGLLDQTVIDEHSRRLLEALHGMAPGARRIVDKMPLNFLHLGAIELLLPGARVIHCTRHPLDTCISIFFNDFDQALPYTRKFDTLGLYYRHYVALMQHWRDTVRVPIFDLNYESLVAAPEATIRELLEFCGLDWSDNCLEFSKQSRHVDTPSYHQVRQPMYSRSVGRYKNYRDGLGELIEALGDVLDGWPQ